MNTLCFLKRVNHLTAKYAIGAESQATRQGRTPSRRVVRQGRGREEILRNWFTHQSPCDTVLVVHVISSDGL
jgi:hypothetical protein